MRLRYKTSIPRPTTRRRRSAATRQRRTSARRNPHMSTRSSNGNGKVGVMSRRGFLKGAGVTAVGTALGESALEALAAPDAEMRRPVLGPGSVKINLDINGQQK